MPKSPSNLNSPTSALAVDSEGCCPDLWPESVDLQLGSWAKSKVSTSGKSAAMSPIKTPPEEFIRSVQKPAPGVMLSSNDTSCLNFDDEDPKVSLNAPLATDLEREREITAKTPPVDNKSHLNAEEHAVSSEEIISRTPLVCDKVSLNAGLLVAWEKELEGWTLPVDNKCMIVLDETDGKKEFRSNKTHLNSEKHAVSSEESTSKMPLVCDKESLSALAPEYDAGSSFIEENIKILGDHYLLLRRMQNDGNSFYRAFLIAYMENIWQSKDANEVTRVKENMQQCMNILEAGGCYHAIFESDFCAFFENMQSIVAETQTSEEFLVILQDTTVSDILVRCLRYVTAAGYLNQPLSVEEMHDENIVTDFDEDKSIQRVIAMGQEVEDIRLSDLCSALGVPFRVIDLEKEPPKAGSAANPHVYVPQFTGCSMKISSLSGNSKEKVRKHPATFLVVKMGRPIRHSV